MIKIIQWSGILSILLLLPILARGQHFIFENTPVDGVILIRDLVLTDRHIDRGDEVGVFTPDGICAGGGVIEDGLPVGLVAFGDDALTPDSVRIEGFVDGEEMFFRYWDESDSNEFEIPLQFVLSGDLIWRVNSMLWVEMADNGRHFTLTPTIVHQRVICTRLDVFVSWNDRRQPEDLDQIGIFTEDEVPAGLMIWNEARRQASGWAYGDNPATEVIEGFTVGESLSFRYYRRSADWDTYADVVDIQGSHDFEGDEGVSVVALRVGEYAVPFEPTDPGGFRLTGPYPNPFNMGATIGIEMDRGGVVEAVLLDVQGRRVTQFFNGSIPAGLYLISLNGAGLSEGVYFCRILTPFGVETRQVVLQK